MEWRRGSMIFCILVAIVHSQQFTQEQIQLVRQALEVSTRLNNSNPTSQEIQNVASTILTNNVIMGLIRQLGIIDTQTPEGASLLIAGANHGNIILMQTAINSGAYINLRDENGWTALIWATSNNHTSAAIYLIQLGADVNIKNSNYGDSALTWAVFHGNLEITKALVHAGADVNILDFDGDSPINTAAPKGFLEIVDFLIASGADVDSQDNDGFTALILASSNNHIEIVRTLLKAGANPNLRTAAANYGETALIWAVAKGYTDVVRELIVNGADVNIASNLGVTPLSYAAKNNRPAVARLLLSAGADIDKQAQDGDTAMMDAANLGYVEVIKVFLEHCPNILIRNGNRKNVADIALSRQIPEMINAIAAHPNLVCDYKGINFKVGETRYDVCRQVQCCQGIWSPTGEFLSTCGAQCRRLLAPAGVCTPIDNCPHLAQEFEAAIVGAADQVTSGFQFLKSYGCRSEEEKKHVRVCCPSA